MRYLGRLILGLFMIGGALAIVSLAIEYWYFVLLAVLALLSPRIVREVRKRIYFSSPEFQSHLTQIESLVSEHNELSEYIEEIRSRGRFSIGVSSTGTQAGLATTKNTSRFGYKRNRNEVDLTSRHVHHASLQVVKNASLEPVRYLIKYFDIPATEQKLEEIEELGESVSRLENAVESLREQELEIADQVSPPAFIIKHFLEEFQSKVGLQIPKLTIPYPVYKFQYVSAGGNSSQETEVKLTSKTIDALIETLSERIKFRKSAAGQRSLMTARFREFIKARDSHTCKICSISVEREPHLLLEVDHIIPLSKGGQSSEENLQTLCWKCNRSKGAKIL